MTSNDAELPFVKIRVPGPQNFTDEQRESIQELLADVRADGFEASWPIRRTASTGQALLEVIGLVIADKVADKTLDISIGRLLDIGIDWTKAQYRKIRRKPGEPPRTTQVIIYGPDDQPLKTVDVLEDDEDDED